MISDCQEWSARMFEGSNLGDARRVSRLVDVAARLASHAGESLSSACEGDAAALEGGYRFVRNPHVEAKEILLGGTGGTIALLPPKVDILVIQDSTTLGYAHEVEEGLGDLGGGVDAKHQGFWVHSSLGLNAETGEILGLVHQEWWVRPLAERGKRHERKKRKYEEKESVKWQRNSEALEKRIGPEMSRVIEVSDRESDIFRYLSYKTQEKQRYIVRMERNRLVVGEHKYVLETAKNFQEAFRCDVLIPQRGGRPARTARLVVRAGGMSLKSPSNESPKFGPITTNVVYATEVDSPAGVEPLNWVLLSSEPIDEEVQISRILNHYRRRWWIEDWHKSWKTGCGVERLRMQSSETLMRMATILAFIAVRLIQLQDAATKSPEAPCEALLSQEEWTCLWASTQKVAPPPIAPTLQWALRTLARLGGWADTKQTGRPGWVALWRGWLRLGDRLEGWRLARDLSVANV